jgi:hypothetical protein
MPDPQLPPFVENDPVRNLPPQAFSQLTRDSGSTGMEMSLPSASKTAEHPSGNGTCERRSSCESARLNGHCSVSDQPASARPNEPHQKLTVSTR